MAKLRKLIARIGLGSNKSEAYGQTDTRPPPIDPIHKSHPKSPSHLPEGIGNLQSGGTVFARKDGHLAKKLHQVLRNAEVRTALALIEQGADVHSRGELHRTPLHLAAMNGYKAVAETLIKHGADLEAQDKYFWTPLIFAYGFNHPTLIEVLLSHGANINYQDDDGWTPMHQAAGRYPETTRLLLERGADWTLKTIDGRTPLEYARDRGDVKSVQAIISHERRLGLFDNYRLLCGSCTGISYQPLKAPDRILARDSDTFTIKGLVHSESYELLDKSARTCLSCFYIRSSFQYIVGTKDQWRPVILCFDDWMTDDNLFLVQVQLVGIDPKKFGANKLEISAERESTAAQYGRFGVQPFPADAICDSNIAAIRKWRRLCRDTHSQCRFEATNVLPKRLIDLQSPYPGTDARLIDTSNQEMKYCTLSYCWGFKQYQTLNATTEAIFYGPKGIDLSMSPKSCQDAVQVAKSLGMRYLWIDALCIMQDDRADWEAESVKMGEIYRNSSFTIAATGALSAEDGFLGLRRDEHHIQIPYDGPGHQSGDCFYLHPRYGRYDETVDSTTWNRRGWTLQERYLSRNTIHFTAGPIVLECYHGRRTEIHSHDPDLWWKLEDSHKPVYTRDEGYTIELRKQVFPSVNWEPEDWDHIVQEYTNRSFTFPEDKTRAIEGLVSIMGQKENCTYACGLWFSRRTAETQFGATRREEQKGQNTLFRESLQKQLLWYRTGPRRQPPRSRAYS